MPAAAELESNGDESVPNKAARRSDDDESDDVPRQRRLSRTLVSDTKQKPTTRKTGRANLSCRARSLQNTAKGSGGASTSPNPGKGQTKSVASGTSTAVGDDTQPSVSGAGGIKSMTDVSKRKQQDGAGRDARVKRLQRAREVFFEQLKSTMDKGIVSDELDQLYVVAMSWRSCEDLLWPSELQ